MSRLAVFTIAAVAVTPLFALRANADSANVVFTPEMALEADPFETRVAASKVQRGSRRTDDTSPSLRPGTDQFLKVIDPGENSPLDFAAGDTLSIAAWIRIDDVPTVAFPYIVGKGRTHTGLGTHDANQNYALRLQGTGKTNLSFLWMDSTGTAVSQSAHRWTSKASVPIDGRWHHVALTYTFGTGDEVEAWIDGTPTAGEWDMRGNSPAPPVVDNDDLWVGASMKGGHLFPGQISELTITRGTLPLEEIEATAQWVDTQKPDMPWDPDGLPVSTGKTAIAVYDMPARGWFSKPTSHEPPFESDGFALTRLPYRYTSRGVIGDRKGASIVRLATSVNLEPGKHSLLLRTLDAARVYVGNKLVAEAKSQPKRNGSAHNKVYELEEPPNGVVQGPAAHRDVVTEFTSEGGPIRIEAYRLLGGDRVPQLGEFLVAMKSGESPYRVVGSEWTPDDANWQRLLDGENEQLVQWNRAARASESVAEQDRWRRRHEESHAAAAIALQSFADEASVDSFIDASLAAKGLDPTDLATDDQFLRRIALDTVGRGPTLDELNRFGRNGTSSTPLDRAAVIEHYLASDEWADHWTAYFMDVLAENPALTKPTLNNSGPFRRFIHDALVDNWGMDRFVTALIRMDGSRYEGGPAGFGMATQNDVPMAAKAHIVGTAFLGVEMKCARCHDAPGHPFKQSDLFSVAALLNRKPLEVPATSSIPATPEELAEMVVSVSIKPGEKIAPAWPFPDLSDTAVTPDDGRELLARMVTDPDNARFREVMVNRLWTRLIGAGLVESTGDWSEREPSHPELLRWLSLQMLASGDDLKHVARLIFSSNLYQRVPAADLEPTSLKASEFRGPIRRRLTAEQVVDSLHTATGKPMRTEIQSFSPDGVSERNKFLEMGRATRAWQLICTASERDRQSLSLPAVDSLNELLQSYGWRPQRQEPRDREDVVPTPLRPMMLANGPAAARLIDATPESNIVRIAVDATSVEDVINGLTRSVYGRAASPEELERFTPVLAAGFDSRLTGQQDDVRPVYRHRVTWRNHFDPQAEVLVQNRWSQIESGDQPTRTLTTQWRQRAEDVLWVLINSPEFAWVP